jgi:putative DNA primase/helicase
MGAGVAPSQRFTTRQLCPVCGGHDRLPRGNGRRCYGFLSSDGRYAHCSRAEHAGGLPLEAESDTHAHRLEGSCRCGVTHGEPEPVPAAIRRNGASRQREYRELGPIEAEYIYPEADGQVWHRVTRHRDPKDFCPWHGGPAAWKKGEGGQKLPLYRLPELIAADPAAWVLIEEGEKDADRLAALGFVATTNAGGAGKWRPELSEYLRGRRVCILQDNDDAGERDTEIKGQLLAGIAAEIRVLHLPGLLDAGDVSDWLDAGGTPEDLVRLIADAPAWEPKADAGPSDTRAAEPAGVLASDVQPERVSFLWPGRLAAGKPTVLDGDPGLGKSTAALDIAARITTGTALPGRATGAKPRGVVLLSAEDGAADTIVPRLKAAGADLARLFIMQGVKAADGECDPVTLPAGLAAVEHAIRDYDAALLIVDPLMAYLGADTNAHRDQDVRRALAPLAAILERTGCAGLLIRHLNKAQASAALYRGGGSIGIIGAARFGLLVAKDPDDDTARILAPTKCNIGPEPPALRYRLEGAPGSDAARVVWDAAAIVSFNAADLLAASDEANRSELDEARAWLKDYLSGGARPADDALREGRKAGITDATLRRAKRALAVESTKSGFGSEGRWAWSLPDHITAENAAEGAAGEAADSPKVSKEPLRRPTQTGEHLRQSVSILGAKPARVCAEPKCSAPLPDDWRGYYCDRHGGQPPAAADDSWAGGEEGVL